MSEYLNKLLKGTRNMFKEFFSKKTNKKQRANMLTFSRLLIAPIIPIFAILGLPLAAAISVLVGGFTDYLDGKSARKYNSSSEYGALLDQVVDKVFSGFIGIALSILNPIFLINLLGEIVISTTNIGYKLKYKDLNTDSTIIGKIKQWPLALTFALGFGSFAIPGLINLTNYLIAFTSLMQVMTLGSYIIKNNEQIKSTKRKQRIDKIKSLANDNKDLEIIKTFELENTNSIDNKNSLKKEQYIKLKNVLNEIIDMKSDQDIEYLKNYQKIKND